MATLLRGHASLKVFQKWPRTMSKSEGNDFVAALCQLHDKEGYIYSYMHIMAIRTRLNLDPVIGNQKIDVQTLYQSVIANGGYQAVTDSKKWDQIAVNDLGISSSINSAYLHFFFVAV